MLLFMSLLNNMTSSSKNFLDQFKIGSRLLFAVNLTTKNLISRDIEYLIVGGLTNSDITINQTLWFDIYSGHGKEQLVNIAERK